MNTKWSGMVLMAVAASTLGCATEGPYNSSRMSSSRTGTYDAHYAPAPALDPNRRISVQDCTKPFTPDGGNLVCK